MKSLILIPPINIARFFKDYVNPNKIAIRKIK